VGRVVRIAMFALARDAAGTARVDVPVPPDGLPARSLVRDLGRRFPDLVPVLRVARFVRNGRYLTRLDTRIRPGDEFAVHPPYGGG
jgi:molybdopterin converting factor small subunit